MTSNAHAIEALYATGHWLFTNRRYADAAKVFRAMALAQASDERSWLALGACHEAIGQHRIAIELYVVAAVAAAPAIRCEIARARALRVFGREDEAAEVLLAARDAAYDADEAGLAGLASAELVAA